MDIDPRLAVALWVGAALFNGLLHKAWWCNGADAVQLTDENDQEFWVGFFLGMIGVGHPGMWVLVLGQWTPTWRTLWTWAKKSGATPSNPNDLSASITTTSQHRTGQITRPFAQLPQSGPSLPSSHEGPVIGYRAFECKLLDDDYMLMSVVIYCLWKGPSMVDSVLPNQDAHALTWNVIPYRTEGFGFHAVNSLDNPKWREYAPNLPQTTLTRVGLDPNVLTLVSCPVVGKVECFGGIVECEYGWRSQGQCIRKLWVPVQDTKLVADLERRYQCEVVVAPKIFRHLMPVST